MEFINLKAEYEALKPKIDIEVQKIMKQGNFIMAKNVSAFEKKLAEYVGTKYVISCGNGTDALQLIYMAYEIGKDDAVFCPDMTFIASVEPAVMLGAHPVFCDIDLDTYNISLESLEKMIRLTIKEGKYTPKAIVAVDFLGNPIKSIELHEIAKKYNLLLIEDAAQGMGSMIGEKKCGSFGDVAATSFFPTKPLGCYGDGGAVFTNDESIKEKIQSLRVHGKGKSKYDNIRIGVNSRLDSIQAAILLVKLEILDEKIQRRQEIADYYSSALRGSFKVPFVEKNKQSSFAQYVVMADDEKQRMDIMYRLQEKNIPSLQYYPNPMHKLPVFQYLGCNDDDFRNTNEYCRRAFAIPFSPYLLQEEQDEVIEVLVSK